MDPAISYSYGNPAPLTCALPERVATVGEGVKDSLPIVISYLPVAFAFGLNATRLGFTPLESLFFSCIIYAGASQFVITAMLAAGSSLWVAAPDGDGDGCPPRAVWPLIAQPHSLSAG